MDTSRIANALAAAALACALLACERHFTGPTQHNTTASSPPQASDVAAGRAPIPATPQRSQLPAPSSDLALASRITSAILSDPGMAGADVSVNSEHGVVSLTGNVKSQEQAAIASALAQREDGVMRIDNHLALNTQ